jgi:hypothetical protein
LLGVVDPNDAASTRQDNSRGHDGTGERSSPGLIETGDTAIAAPPGLQLKFVGRSHEVAYTVRLIGQPTLVVDKNRID